VKRLIFAAGLVAALACGPTGEAAAVEPRPPVDLDVAPVQAGGTAPYMLTRSLQGLQDQIALGSSAAHDAQRKLLAHIAERFLAADPQVWSDPRNARAALTYVLSGGQPQVMRRLLELGSAVPLDPDLMAGALAYVEGRETEAAELLGGVDARSLPPGLGGHVALVQATLAMRRSPRKAIAFLDVARLLMPGTLVEEAALRREVFAAGETGQTELFLVLARQYVQRFQHSVYAASFTDQFAEALARLDFDKQPDSLEKVDGLLAGLSEEARRSMYLSIASAALVNGRTRTALFAAGKAKASAAPGSAQALKAELYEAAAEIVTDGFEAARRKLDAIDAARLSPSDAEILAAARALAEQLRRWPPDAGAPPAAEVVASAEQAPPATTPLMDRAREAISASEQLLQRTKP
jgi:chemotaxis protein MotC